MSPETSTRVKLPLPSQPCLSELPPNRAGQGRTRTPPWEGSLPWPRVPPRTGSAKHIVCSSVKSFCHSLTVWQTGRELREIVSCCRSQKLKHLSPTSSSLVTLLNIKWQGMFLIESHPFSQSQVSSWTSRWTDFGRPGGGGSGSGGWGVGGEEEETLFTAHCPSDWHLSWADFTFTLYIVTQETHLSQWALLRLPPGDFHLGMKSGPHLACLLCKNHLTSCEFFSWRRNAPAKLISLRWVALGHLPCQTCFSNWEQIHLYSGDGKLWASKGSALRVYIFSSFPLGLPKCLSHYRIHFVF